MHIGQLSRCSEWADIELVLFGGQSGKLASETIKIGGPKWRAGGVEHFMVGTSFQLGFITKVQLNYTNVGLNELVIDSVSSVCLHSCFGLVNHDVMLPS